MASHNFNFAGGEILTKIGASWFVSYSYYEKIDSSHKNWEKVKTASSRISYYSKSKQYHELWLQKVLTMNLDFLNTNTIGIKADKIKIMAKELLDTCNRD